MSANVPHALYRFYSDNGQLLYVGITKNPGQRFDQHSETKAWWHRVRGISVDWYPTRQSAIDAETRAIDIENPVYNIQRPGLRKEKESDSCHTANRLVWVCRECRSPIRDGDGYLHVDYSQLRDIEAAWREYEQDNEGGWRAVNLSELLSLPPPAQWQPHHRDCDPEPDSPDYWFDVGRARTNAHLLDWTAHLMEKSWLRFTDWNRLIKRMAALDA